MTEREARMRSIEALSAMGVREAQRLIREADAIAEWVMAGEEKAATPPRRKKAGDNQQDMLAS